MNEPVIQFDCVCKQYPLYHNITGGGIKTFLFHLPAALKSMRSARFEALRNVSFEVRRGETFGVVGRNGAGKSTTLGLIAGVIQPTSGTVTVKGRISPLLELGAGFHPELSGRENILLNGVLLGLTRAQVASKMDEIVDFSELNGFIEQPIRTYSSGMLARLGFSVVAHLDPEILLVDELLAVGDAQFQAKCMQQIAKFRQNGVTTVFVSHTAVLVKKLCDRVMLIENHEVKKIGRPDEVLQAEPM